MTGHGATGNLVPGGLVKTAAQRMTKFNQEQDTRQQSTSHPVFRFETLATAHTSSGVIPQWAIWPWPHVPATEGARRVSCALNYSARGVVSHAGGHY